MTWFWDPSFGVTWHSILECFFFFSHFQVCIMVGHILKLCCNSISKHLFICFVVLQWNGICHVICSFHSENVFPNIHAITSNIQVYRNPKNVNQMKSCKMDEKKNCVANEKKLGLILVCVCACVRVCVKKPETSIIAFGLTVRCVNEWLHIGK